MLDRARRLGQQLAQTQNHASHRIANGDPAIAGKRRDDNTVTLSGDAANDDRLPYPLIYVRLNGNDYDVRVASNVQFWGGVEANDELLVRKTHRGDYKVVGVDDRLIAARLGAQASDHARPAGQGSKRESVRERSLMMGRLILAEAGTLTVTLEPVLFQDSSGNWKVWDSKNPTLYPPLDLSSSVPAAVSGMDQQRYVYVSLDPTAGAYQLVAHAGTAQSVLVPLPEFGYADLIDSIPDGHYLCGPVLLKTGDTTVTISRFDNTPEKRGWVGRFMLARKGIAVGGEETVKVSGGDTTANYLENKLVAGDGITITKDDDDGDEYLQVSAAPKGQVQFSFEGDLSVTQNPLRVYNRMGATKTLLEVFLSVATAPTGQEIVVDLHKNGSTVFTTQTNRPEIETGETTGLSTTFDDDQWEHDSYLEVHIDQVGSGVVGANLVVHVVYQ